MYDIRILLTWVWFPAEEEIFLFTTVTRLDLAHPSSYSASNGCKKLSIRLHVVPSIRIFEIVVIAWCLIKHRGSFILWSIQVIIFYTLGQIAVVCLLKFQFCLIDYVH
jgi:hypothetical protein